MATVTQSKTEGAQTRSLEGERRFLLTDIGWEAYESLLTMVGDGHTRVTYDRGEAELMSPSQDHEFFKKLLGWMLEAVFEELDISYQAVGSTTWRSLASGRGLEADECFYLSRVDLARQKRDRLDPTSARTPDLAVEVEISPSALDRLTIYAALGVAEVWRFDGESLAILRLREDGTYSEVNESPGVVGLRRDDVVHWVRLSENASHRPAWNRQFREWIRAELAPRHEGRIR